MHPEWGRLLVAPPNPAAIARPSSTTLTLSITLLLQMPAYIQEPFGGFIIHSESRWLLGKIAIYLFEHIIKILFITIKSGLTTEKLFIAHIKNPIIKEKTNLIPVSVKFLEGLSVITSN